MESNKNNKLNFKKRNLLAMFGLMFITFGFYGIYWFYKTNIELKKYDKNAPNFYLLYIAFIFSIFGYNFFEVLKASKIINYEIIIIFLSYIIYLFFMGYYCYFYSKSMSKVTKIISKWMVFILIFLIPLFFNIIEIIFKFKLEFKIFFLYFIILVLISLCFIYLLSIYNKCSGVNLIKTEPLEQITKIKKELIFKKRNLWRMLALMFITFGLYGIYWFYKTNFELKKYDKNAPWKLELLFLNLFFIISLISQFLIENLDFNYLKKSFESLFGIIFLFLIFKFFNYIYNYSSSMSKITNIISKWKILTLIFAIPIFLIFLDYIFLIFLGKKSISYLFIFFLLFILSFCSIIYLQSIYNKASSQN